MVRSLSFSSYPSFMDNHTGKLLGSNVLIVVDSFILAGLITVVPFATPAFLPAPRNHYVSKHPTVLLQLQQLQRVTIFRAVTIAGKRFVITAKFEPYTQF